MKQQFTTLLCTASLNMFRMPTKTRDYITLQQFVNDCSNEGDNIFWGSPNLKESLLSSPPLLLWRRKETHTQIYDGTRSSPVVNKVTACPDCPCIFYSAPVGHRLRLATSWSQASLSMSPTYHCLIFSFGG